MVSSSMFSCLAISKVRTSPPFFAGFAGLLWLCTFPVRVVAADTPAAVQQDLPKKAKKLFVEEKIWNLHLQFTAEEWAAMEPAGGGIGGFGAAPGGRPGGRGGFGPAMFLAPMFLQAGDDDKDGKLTAGEFQGIAEKWFAAWDKDTAGRVTRDQLSAGLNASIVPPGGGPPGVPGAPASGGRQSGGGTPPVPSGGAARGGGPALQGEEGKRNGLASAMGIEFKYVHADLEFNGVPFKDVAVRYKGNGTYMESRGGLKRSFKIDFNKYEKGQKLAGLTTLNLHTNVTDASWMNEVLSHRLYRDAGVPAPRTAFARVYLTVPGKYEKQYVGLYSIVEDIDQDFADENFGTKKGGIFKPVTPNLFADLGDAWSKYKQIYDPKGEVSTDEAQRVIDFARLVTSADDAEFAAKLGDFVDVDETARYFAVTVWLATMDSILAMGQNYYLYLHPKTHQFQFLPWDLDHSFGQFMGGDQNAQLSIQRPWRGENRFLDRLFKVEAFKKSYLGKLEEFSNSLFAPPRLAQQVDKLAPVIRPAIAEESKEKLASFDQAVAGDSPTPATPGDPPGPGGPGRMGGGKPIKPFAVLRTKSVSDQLAGKAEEPSSNGFGPGGRGGPGGGPGGFGPGNMMAPVFLSAFDTDKDDQLTHEELAQGFAHWFTRWNTEHNGVLTDEQLRAGIDVSFPRRGPPNGPGPGPQQESR